MQISTKYLALVAVILAVVSLASGSDVSMSKKELRKQRRQERKLARKQKKNGGGGTTLPPTQPPPNANVTEEQEYLDRKREALDKYINFNTQDQEPKIDDDIYTNERFDARKKREAQHPGFLRRERAVHSEDSDLKIHLVSFHEKPGFRRKRATYNTTAFTWPNRIPYMFDPTYPQSLRHKVRTIMNEIEDNVCIEWVEEQDFDPNENSYATNAYLLFVGGDTSLCGTVLGRGGNDYGPRSIRTCTRFYSIVHELLHTLGTVHEQQGSLSKYHMSINTANVQNGYYGGTYKSHDHPSKVFSSEFDGSSIMIYGAKSFSKTGLDVMLAYRPDEFNLNYGRRTHRESSYHELNVVYKCKELYCNHGDVDCGLGYYTRVKGVCRCVCPDGFDYLNNCHSLDTGVDGPQDWPEVPFNLYAAPGNVCPVGFTPAKISITGYRAPIFINEQFFKTGSAVDHHMCQRNFNGDPNTDLEAMPMGTYCVVKPLNVACNGSFTEGGYIVASEAAVTTSGNFGDWTVTNNSVKMKFCCRSDREWYYVAELPRHTPFRLISRNGQCPVVKGMRFSIGRIAMFTRNTERYGTYPQSWLKSSYIVHNFCTYTPPTYGCNREITLDANNLQETVSTPGFASSYREGNTRCLFNFKVPEGARIKIRFEEFDLETTDTFLVRRFNKWSRPQYDFVANFKKEIISEKDFMFLEYWTGAYASSTKKGIQLVASVILKEESCYNPEDRGLTYDGFKWVSEDFEPCVQWKDAVECEDFPFSTSESLHILSKYNFCRNPGGMMTQPWCYVSVSRGNCRRAYCDVCNKLSDEDQLPNCQSLIANDYNFCFSALQKTKCATSCFMFLNQPAPVETHKCGAPSVPSDGEPVAPLKTEYEVGELVQFRCLNREGDDPPTEIECTTGGWPQLVSACAECPAGGVPYGDRCFIYKQETVYIDQAEDYCESRGGQLFVIRDEDDFNVIRNFKQTSDINNVNGGSWVNAILVAGEWKLYTNQTADLPYINWASGVPADDPNHNCAVMNYEGDTSGNAGKFLKTDCNLAISRTFCEVPRLAPAECKDKSSHCVNALTQDPYLCSRPRSYSVGSQYCEQSCGECIGTYGQCTEPTPANYHRLSPHSQVNVSDVMEFACDPGFYLVGGDLKRACGFEGSLLGTPPNCSPYPNSELINVNDVLYRDTDVAKNLAILLDLEEYRVPFSGFITHWHYYARKVGAVTFLVYREDFDTKLYQLVGYNTVTISNLNMRWTHLVDPADQIPVEQGDVIGVYTTAGRIAVTSCDAKEEQISILKTQAANTLNDLIVGQQPFATTTCKVLSLGATVDAGFMG